MRTCTNPDLLYLGTEFALFASINRGADWFKINGAALPTVAVHEIAQPTTANEIVAATHGRSLWVLDVTTLRQLKPSTQGTGRDAVRTRHRSRAGNSISPTKGCSAPGRATSSAKTRHARPSSIFTCPPKRPRLSLKIIDPTGNLVRELDLAKEKEPGMHRIEWDLVSGPAPKGGKTKESKTPLHALGSTRQTRHLHRGARRGWHSQPTTAYRRSGSQNQPGGHLDR